MTHNHVLKSLPTTELFSLIANNEELTTISLRAFKEFEDRYGKVLWNICKEVCAKHNFDKIPGLDKDVYRTSMQEIYLNAKSYKISNGKHSSKYQDQLLIGWLGNIAESVKENIIAEHNNFEKMHCTVPDYDVWLDRVKSFQKNKEEIEEEEKMKAEKEISKTRKLLVFQMAMKKLKPREREIIIEYYQVTGDRKYLREERIAYLCKKWNISLDNLIHIKHRAIKKLKRFCEDEEKKAEIGDRFNT